MPHLAEGVRDRFMTPEEVHNEKAWDALVLERSRFANPVRSEDLANPENIINPFDWLTDSLKDRRVLCLAAGGGRHGPVFAKAGAMVTVVDISEEMLRLDQGVAQREGITLRTLKASMTNLGELGDGVFDIVMQPVSTCYVSDLDAVYREVARVIVPGGTYIVQHKQPVSLQAATSLNPDGQYAVTEQYYREGPLPPVMGSKHREEGTQEFLHTLESLVGGLCRSGFTIDDLREPRHGQLDAAPGSFSDRSRFIPPYVAIKATRRTGGPEVSRIWLPS